MAMGRTLAGVVVGVLAIAAGCAAWAYADPGVPPKPIEGHRAAKGRDRPRMPLPDWVVAAGDRQAGRHEEAGGSGGAEMVSAAPPLEMDFAAWEAAGVPREVLRSVLPGLQAFWEEHLQLEREGPGTVPHEQARASRRMFFRLFPDMPARIATGEIELTIQRSPNPRPTWCSSVIDRGRTGAIPLPAWIGWGFGGGGTESIRINVTQDTGLGTAEEWRQLLQRD